MGSIGHHRRNAWLDGGLLIVWEVAEHDKITPQPSGQLCYKQRIDVRQKWQMYYPQNDRTGEGTVQK